MRHYYEHALASPFADRVSVHMPDDTQWNEANPWLRHRSSVVQEIDWQSVEVTVISGWGWDRFIPARFHKAPPFKVIYLVQSFGRIDPSDSQFRHLANPATRICVSHSLAEELRKLEVNGAIHTIPAGIEVGELRTDSPKDIDVLVVGFKRMQFAKELAASLAEAGLSATVFMERRARAAFLSEMSRARVVVCLPSPREGFYLPALEAMAVGALTVCPDAGGNEYCEDGVNCLQPVYEVDAIARATLIAHRLPSAAVTAMLRNASATAMQHDLAAERTRFHAVLRDLFVQPSAM